MVAQHAKFSLKKKKEEEIYLFRSSQQIIVIRLLFFSFLFQRETREDNEQSFAPCLNDKRFGCRKMKKKNVN